MKESRVHISTRTLIRFWLVIIALALLILGLWLARSAVVIVLVSFFMAIVLNRPVSFFAKHIPGKSRALGVLISYIITIAIIAGALILILPLFFEQSLSFINSLPDTLAHMEENSAWLNNFVEQYNLQTQYNELLVSLNDSVKNAATSIGLAMVDIVSGIVNWILAFIFVLFITFFMLTEGPNWMNKYWKMVYRDADKREYHKVVAQKMYEVISGFVSGQILVSIVSGVLSGIGVLALSMIFGFSVSIVLPIAAIVFVSSFIPMFGGFIGGLISALLMLLYNPIAAIIYVAYFMLYQQFLGSWFAPKVQGKRMNISPLIVLVALTVGFQMAGIFGALVSIPLAGCVVVVVREYFCRHRNIDQTADIDIVEVGASSQPKSLVKKGKKLKN